MRRGILFGLGLLLLTACGDDASDGTDGSGSGASAGVGGANAGGGPSSGPGGDQGAGGSGAGNAVGGSGGDGGGAGGGQPLMLGPEFCPAPGDVGVQEGQQLGDIVVKTCDGEDFSLDQLCGAEALWIFAAHGWCPLCQSVSGYQEEVHDAYAGQGLVTVAIVVEDGNFNEPDEAFCQIWRDEHGHDDVITLFDPTGAALALWPGGSSSLHAFVDRDRIIKHKLQYTSNQSSVETAIMSTLE